MYGNKEGDSGKNGNGKNYRNKNGERIKDYSVVTKFISDANNETKNIDDENIDEKQMS